MARTIAQVMTQLMLSAAVALFVDHLKKGPGEPKPQPLSVCVALVVLTSLLAA